MQILGGARQQNKLNIILTWGKWIPIVREKYGKTKHSKAKGSYIFRVEQKYIRFPKHRKSELHWYEKSMGKRKHSKIMGFLNISRRKEIHTISKTWEKWIPIVRKNYGKTKIFQRYRFLTYFGWNKNLNNSEKMGKMNSHSKGKTWENTNISKLWVSYMFLVKH